jgi:hypothetical protein
MENKISDPLFGPISKDYCLLFYILALFALISCIVIVFTTIALGISGKKSFSFYLQGFLFAVMYGVVYLQNRLLLNICKKDL